MQVNITFEGKKSIEAIQKEFQGQLSEKQILKTTAYAINETAKRVVSRSKKEIKQEYTVNNKYLNRIHRIKKASGTTSGLYAEIYFSGKPIPMIGFKYKDKSKKGGKRLKSGGVIVEIFKGKQQLLKHAFIATMKSGHTGIFGNGSYIEGKFVHSKERTASHKSRITEYKSPSPYSMERNKGIKERNFAYIETTLPSRTRALLQNKLNKLTK